MNRGFVLENLREAAEELAQAVIDIEADPDYDSDELLVAMQHAYHHLNSAWNGQKISPLKADNMTGMTWSRLGEFPSDFPLLSSPVNR
jgi:hypothetical protein